MSVRGVEMLRTNTIRWRQVYVACVFAGAILGTYAESIANRIAPPPPPESELPSWPQESEMLRIVDEDPINPNPGRIDGEPHAEVRSLRDGALDGPEKAREFVRSLDEDA